MASLRLRVAFVVMAGLMIAAAAAHADCVGEHKRARALRDTLASVGATTPEYRAMLVKKIQDAENAAASCDRAAADARRTEEARAAARRRELEEAAKKEAADRFAMDVMKSQADFVRKAWSAYECSYEKERDALLGNPFATPEQKERLRRTETILSGVRSAMKRGKLAQLSCRADDVAKLAFCIADSSANAACGEPEMALMVRADKEIIASGQLTPSTPPLGPSEQRAKDEADKDTILKPDF